MSGDTRRESREINGGGMTNARNSGQAELVIALMIVILVIGMFVDTIFTGLARHVRTRRGPTGFR